MKILIIEDEPLVAKNLVNLVKTIEPEATILEVLDSVKSSVKWFSENPEPDIILSDIQLSDGVSFDIFQEISVNCPIIFTTAFDEYAIRAFKLNSIDYLLKPIDNQELTNAFEKFKRLGDFGYAQSPSNDFSLNNQINQLLDDLKNRDTKKHKTRFTAHHHRNIVAIPEEKVVCFYRDEVIWLQTTDNLRLITDYNSLDEIEELLNPDAYFRANRQWIVRKQAIESYRSHFTGKIELKLINPTKEEIVVSKEKAHQFRGWFE
jgi:two-component system, LytTR family, response regulator